MPVTEEPRGLTWINNVNTNAFGSLTSQVCWIVGSFVLTGACYQLLTGPTEQHRQAGIFLAGILVAAWTGKTVAGVVDSQNKRKANPAYAEVLEAKERGAKAGAAAAVVLKEAAADLKVARALATREHQAPPAPPTRERPTGDARVDDESGS